MPRTCVGRVGSGERAIVSWTTRSTARRTATRRGRNRNSCALLLQTRGLWSSDSRHTTHSTITHSTERRTVICIFRIAKHLLLATRIPFPATRIPAGVGTQFILAGNVRQFEEERVLAAGGVRVRVHARPGIHRQHEIRHLPADEGRPAFELYTVRRTAVYGAVLVSVLVPECRPHSPETGV